MTKNPFFDNWLKVDFTTPIPGFGGAPVDMKNIMESGRKTFQAITEAQQIALESMQTIAQRQTEILSQFVQDQSAIARDIANEGTPEEKIARSAELFGKAFEKTVSSSREVADILNKSAREASDIINNRVKGAINEIKTTVEEASSKAA
ncbi:MAG: hypothetical protein DI586_08440 [Micavibrio aeruginosavorus]|uniref:Phasin domain-containing protein n=1 Tax=Micavibrio aeruginosavorus TaxID=349221 RepID=A0A2W5FM81_9BACT|nr:MAG: hypothetical protein DI586_08440 [Micavibrio aeruginosavorus]